MGFCCAYFIFVSKNLRFLTMVISECKWVLPDWFFIALQVAIYIPLAWVRRIKHFSITSIIADVFILMGLSYILYFDIQRIATHGIAKDIVWINTESFSLFVGTAMFAFEGICLILPIADSMKKPEKFQSVISWSMVVIGTVFITIGLMGYLALGGEVGTVVFMDLPPGPVPTGLQFVYAIAIILSFPLCVYPAIRITEQGIFGTKDGKSSHLVKWQKNFYRTFLVTFLGCVAWAGTESLDKVVSLVGCFACIPLSFIYPAIFHYKIADSKWIKLKDLLLVIFGTLAMIYTTWITLQQWASTGATPAKDPCGPVPSLFSLPSFF
jgi:proton-coupled amino acid transporter